MSDLSKTYLGQYQLIEPIGHGGMSTVYKAYQASLDRYVAVKVLLSNHDAQFASRFRREARAVATLQHPNILPIYDYGEQSTLAYFVMQYVENGVTLQERLGTPLAPTEAIPLIGQVLGALEYAHARGIVHRDIKPANVLLPAPTWAMLADFGIAKLVNDSQNLTLTGFIIGTAAYMAPEQAAGRPVDARTDLYSVGVMLYELLAGQPPFYADTPMALLTQHVYDPPPPPRTINPQIHPAVEEALLQALAKHPDDRYQNAAEMRADLERVLTLLGKPYVSPRVTDLYNAGVQAFQAQRWDEAVDRLNRALMLDPDHDDAAGLLDLAREERNAARRQYVRSQANTNPRPAVAAVGATIGQAARNPPAARPQRIRCPECGRVVQSDWQICPYCRTAITPETPAQATPLATPAISPPAAVADAPSVPIALGAPVELTPASLGPRPAPLPAAASPSAPKPAITSPLAAAIAEPAGRSRAVWPALLAGVVLLAVAVAIWRPWRSSGTGGANGQAIVEPAASGAPALIGATRTITPSATLTSTPTSTPAPTDTPAPTSTPTDTPAPTSTPTDTPAPTEPPKPTATPKPKPTARPKPSATPEPPPTATPEPPTATPEPPTATPEPPTATPEPSRPRKTPTPEG